MKSSGKIFLESSKELKIQTDEKPISEIWDSGTRLKSYSTFTDLEGLHHFRKKHFCLSVSWQEDSRSSNAGTNIECIF